MTAQKVTLVLDECDAGLNQVTQGFVQIEPSARLPDPLDMAIVGQAPVTGQFSASGAPQVSLVGTDQVGPQPDGWTYSITYYHVPGVPFGYTWSFYLPYAGGAVQHLSSLAQVPVAQPGAQYVPLPSSAPPAAGLVWQASGSGYLGQWVSIAQALTVDGGSAAPSGVAAIDGGSASSAPAQPIDGGRA